MLQNSPQIRLPHLLPALACSLLFAVAFASAADDGLEQGFHNPPPSAKPQVYWFWMNGNVTREGITADLEAMHRVGIGETTMMTGAIDIPPGPVPVMRPQYFDMVGWTIKESRRLGMTLCMANCPGWATSGGPWVPPEHAMQFVTTSETSVRGPSIFAGKLPQPPTKNDFYKDVSTLAFRTPAGEGEVVQADNRPAVTTSVADLAVGSLLKRGAAGSVTFPIPDESHSFFLQIEFARPVTARNVVITAGGMRAAGGQILVSDDGQTFRNVAPFEIPRSPAAPVSLSLGEASVSARFFRLQFDHAARGSKGVVLKEIQFSDRLMIPNLGAKALFDLDPVDPRQSAKDALVSPAPDENLHREQIVNLTSAVQADGSLNWAVPQGEWTILRVGYTPTGITNHPAPPEATGLECDKLDPAGIEASWNGMMKPMLARLGPQANQVLVSSEIDSYEAHGQNWTSRMIDEFKKRRGYDPTLFLPVMTGRIVDSPELTERFLWDLRRTIADLMAKNFFGRFTELCHESGVQSVVEPYTGPFESSQVAGTCDVPRGEFWSGGNGHASLKMVSSAGHVYGRNIISAESFTGAPAFGNWTVDPYSIKALGDFAFTRGINRYVIHRFTQQPWLNRFPGMTMGQWGINFERTNTWFEQSRAWLTYITRCQYLLQQGVSFADVAYFDGQTPKLLHAGPPQLPKGYDYDELNADVLLSRAKAVDHRIVLDGGPSYALLVLQETDPDLTPEVLKKLRDLVNDGAIVVGRPPSHSLGLQNYPRCDAEVQKLVAEVWGDCDGKTITEHALGRGRVIWGQSLEQALSRIRVLPDFHAPGAASGTVNYIHRVLDHGDLYFVANREDLAVHVDCTFRVNGKVPELWHPDSGVIEPAAAYEAKNGLVTIPIDFDPSGSVFVLFRKDDIPGDRDVKPSRQLVNDSASPPLDGSWKLSFPQNWGAPPTVTLDKLISWPDHTDPGVKYFSGTATYSKDINVSAQLLGSGQMLHLDLGVVKNLAQVKLNDSDLGILWKPPFRVDITTAAKPGANHLEITVTNLWPNRIIGDAQMPDDVEWDGMKLKAWPPWLLDGKQSPTGRLTFTTWHHITKDMPLLPSGLIGPVTLQPAHWVVGRMK